MDGSLAADQSAAETAPRQRVSRSGRGPFSRILLSACSVVLTLIACELGYRLFLWSNLQSPTSLSFRIYDKPFSEFDREFGYRYLPNARSRFLYVHKGKPAEAGTVVVNEYGNIGSGAHAKDWNHGAYRILVAGDSFTACQLPEATWTEYLLALLEAETGRDIALLNYARDGYGVLQIVHMAAMQARQHRPDLVIVAFISDDLHRARFWRTIVEDRNGPRSLVTIEPDPNPDPSRVSEAALIDSRVTAEWSEELVGAGRLDDSLLRSACTTLQRRRQHQHPFYTCFLRTSFLANRLLYRDPYQGLYLPTGNPRISQNSFADDASFCDDVEFLNNYEGKVLFVHLPILQEMQSGKNRLDEQDAALLESLHQLVKRPIVNLIDSRKRLRPEVESKFVRPDNMHPSAIGSQFYAEEIARVVSDLVR